MSESETKSKQESDEKADAVKTAKSAALTPEQKHKNYLDDIERLHNEK